MKVKKSEDEFEKLARLIKEEGEETREVLRNEFRGELRSEIGTLRGEIGTLTRKMQEGFAEVNRRVDAVVQPQLDDHTRRIKNLETVTAKR